MPAFPELCDELAIVDRDVAEGQGRIARQAELVRELDAVGHATIDAQNLLRAMQQRLDAVTAHRRQIARELSCGDPDERRQPPD
jgi:hypothetical protein